MGIRVYPNWKTNFDSKKMVGREAFLTNQSINVIYPNEDNEFMIHNHEKKRDYDVNPCLSKLTNKL